MNKKVKDILFSVIGGILGFALAATTALWYLGFISPVYTVIVASVALGFGIADLIYIIRNPEKFLIKETTITVEK